jgi:hypothetical protein
MEGRMPMPKSLTKVKWAELKEILLHVPVRARSAAWRDSMEFVEQILAGQNNLAPSVDASTMKYSVECPLCHELIGVTEDYVFHALSAKYVHYDCHHKSSGNIEGV